MEGDLKFSGARLRHRILLLPFMQTTRKAAAKGDQLSEVPAKLSEITEFGSLATFVRQFISNPRAMGAAFPSSRKLARRIAAVIPENFQGYVVELGPGTGAVTAALLERGLIPSHIIAVERSLEMVNIIHKRFPKVTAIHGDACDLESILSKHIGKDFSGIDFVVSSLPLRSLPKAVVKALDQQLNLVLTDKGCFVQFTYDIRPYKSCPFQSMTRHESHVIWHNLPPARVDVFEHQRK